MELAQRQLQGLPVAAQLHRVHEAAPIAAAQHDADAPRPAAAQSQAQLAALRRRRPQRQHQHLQALAGRQQPVQVVSGAAGLNAELRVRAPVILRQAAFKVELLRQCIRVVPARRIFAAASSAALSGRIPITAILAPASARPTVIRPLAPTRLALRRQEVLVVAGAKVAIPGLPAPFRSTSVLSTTILSATALSAIVRAATFRSASIRALHILRATGAEVALRRTSALALRTARVHLRRRRTGERVHSRARMQHGPQAKHSI